MAGWMELGGGDEKGAMALLVSTACRVDPRLRFHTDVKLTQAVLSSPSQNAFEKEAEDVDVREDYERWIARHGRAVGGPRSAPWQT